MEFWEENKVMITGCAVALLVLLLAHVVFLGPLSRSVHALADENGKLNKNLEDYYPGGGASVDVLTPMFESSNEKLRERYAGLVDGMSWNSEKPFIVPKDEPQPGFFFRRLLTKKRDELLFYTSTRGMDSIDNSLGFGESVPEDKAVPEMLRNLAVSYEMVTAAADAGVKVIDRIEHTAAADIGIPGYTPFIKEYAVQMSMKCDLDALMKFLHNLDEGRRFFGLIELNVESTGLGREKLLSVDIVCAAFSFFQPDRPMEREKPMGPRTKRPVPTYGL